MRKISQLAMEKASWAWCMPETEKIVIDIKLCCEFAKILDAELWKPHLGCATTQQLLDELKARCGDPSYSTVSQYELQSLP
jgi:hypothetical protein